jgi:hypothetical protein
LLLELRVVEIIPVFEYAATRLDYLDFLELLLQDRVKSRLNFKIVVMYLRD